LSVTNTKRSLPDFSLESEPHELDKRVNDRTLTLIWIKRKGGNNDQSLVSFPGQPPGSRAFQDGRDQQMLHEYAHRHNATDCADTGVDYDHIPDADLNKPIAEGEMEHPIDVSRQRSIYSVMFSYAELISFSIMFTVNS
jgi:hypothetical protein